VIIFSSLLSWVVPGVTISFTSNGEIASRINPGLYALLTPLEAGVADAFIPSRAEIADSMGGVVFMVLDLGKSAVSQEQARFRRHGFLLFVVCMLLVTIPLSLTAYQRVIRAQKNNTATAEGQQWLKGTSYQVDMVNVNDRVVMVTVEGTGKMKPLHQWVNQLCSSAWSTGSRALAHASSPEGQVKQSIHINLEREAYAMTARD
jgi:hypothetical protein